MKFRLPDNTTISTIILVCTAIILTVTVMITDRQDLTSAAVGISALILFLTGILLFAFTKQESVGNRIASLLQVQGTVNICRMAGDLGINGNAWFLPPGHTRETTVMQLMPVSSYNGGIIDTENTWISEADETGILLPPAGTILMEELKARYHLIIPDTEIELFACIREVGEDLLEIADKIEATRTGDTIVITLFNYQLIDGCHRIGEESPACCTMNPCPVCSLFAMILAEGGKRPISVERCIFYRHHARVDIHYTLLT